MSRSDSGACINQDYLRPDNSSGIPSKSTTKKTFKKNLKCLKCKVRLSCDQDQFYHCRKCSEGERPYTICVACFHRGVSKWCHAFHGDGLHLNDIG